jgi:hypothetical protein
MQSKKIYFGVWFSNILITNLFFFFLNMHTMRASVHKVFFFKFFVVLSCFCFEIVAFVLYCWLLWAIILAVKNLSLNELLKDVLIHFAGAFYIFIASVIFLFPLDFLNIKNGWLILIICIFSFNFIMALCNRINYLYRQIGRYPKQG